ncbi:SurA N-terminal domain-containing protein [Frateuria defendens]|uniref:SurA N-terminal domain-containing protein n=1 Tax=Frateuria defendens TaxID=2219559 RepID=UPI00066FE1A5|nr:SurA N-terminal domain-containing protein [Frateuria defendens]
MLQALRNKLHGWPSIVVLGICVFAVAFFGIESYFMSQADTYVAKVGKHEISQQQLQERLNRLRQDDSARLGDSFDASIYEQPAMKQRVLDAMIDQQLLTKANDDLGMRVPDQAVRDMIANIPAFQVNGQFDAGTYRSALASAGQTPASFESDVRSSLAIQMLPNAIAAGTVITEADMDRFLNLRLQRRDLRYFTLPRPALTDSKVADADIDAYYKAHQADFMNPEQVTVNYLEVDGSALKPPAPPTEDELRKRYAEEKQRFVQPEQRLVSHILINVPKNATPAQQKAALAKAEQVAGEARPDNFAKLAAQDSDDLGSKRQGGDLGWLEKGVTNAAFDEALFGLQKGQVSKPVLSDEGYHILWLRDVRSGDVKPFEEVRGQLGQELANTARDRQYNELAGKLADKTYQNPSSLEPAAQALGLTIKDAGPFARQGGSGIAANPKVIAAAFSDDVLAQGNNSGLLEIGPGHAVVIHIDQHTPAAPRALAQVRDAIRQRVLDERVEAVAKKQAGDLLQRLRKGEDMTAVAASVGGGVQSVHEALRVQDGVPEPVRNALFLLPHPEQGKSQFDSVAMLGGSYALLAVDKVQDADLSKISKEQRDALRQSMLKAYGGIATEGYIQALRKRTEITVARDRM